MRVTVPAEKTKASALPSAKQAPSQSPEAESLPRMQAAFDLSHVPIVPPEQGGSPPRPGRGPRSGRTASVAFFNNRSFSRSVARNAVAQASKGAYPFGAQIAKETRGAVNPNNVPATVVSGLPGLGVCYDGRVALRRGAGIDVARHELAHALGANEARADQASHDPSVLASLASQGGAPVDGWKVGFEFQTDGATNPKVYRYDETKDVYVQCSGKGTISYDADLGVRLSCDGKDLEVVTDPVEETEAGQKKLDEQMQGITTLMDDIQQAPDGAPMKLTYKKKRQYDLEKPGPEGKEADYKYCIKHSSGKGPFTAKPQATLGVRFEAIGNLFAELTAQEPVAQKDKAFRGGKKIIKEWEWGDDQIGWSYAGGGFGNFAKKHGKDDVKQVIARVDEQIKAASEFHDDASKYPRLRSVLIFLAAYHAIGQIAKKGAINFKSIAPVMSRHNFADIFKTMTAGEQLLFRKMMQNSQDNDANKLKKRFKPHQGDIAKVFGVANWNELTGQKWLSKGHQDEKDKYPNADYSSVADVLKVYDQVARALYESDDEVHVQPEWDPLSQVSGGGMHGINSKNFDPKANFANDLFDIGVDDSGKRRSGMLVELRGMKGDVPWTKWTVLAHQVFGLATRVHAPFMKKAKPKPPK